MEREERQGRMKEKILSNKEFNTRLRQARKAVAELDRVFGEPECDPLTIAVALEAGLRCPHTNAGFEALAMLEQAIGNQALSRLFKDS
ncbi:MAG TPA: hypothetical protein VF077_13030 [Nitrospiraceae bacterium]